MIVKLFYILIYLSSIFADDITLDVFATYSNHYLPAAFGDFNADKLTDMFVIDKHENGSSSVSILFAHNLPPYFGVLGPTCLFTQQVVSVVPSDFDGDGAMDVLAIVHNDNVYECYILWGNIYEMQCHNESKPLLHLKSQPILLDYNGDMISDLYGENINGSRKVWLFKSKNKPPSPVDIADIEGKQLNPMRISGGHAYGDIDGDLSPDIVVSIDNGFEIWKSSEKFAKYHLVSLPEIQGTLPSVVGQSTFADFNMDGQIEMIVPFCTDDSCSQSFLYTYDFQSENVTKWFNLNVKFLDQDNKKWTFSSGQSAFLYTNIISLRVGDKNLDGYPDLIITLFNGNTPKVVSLINTPCVSTCEFPRTFKIEWKTFDNWPNSVMGTFFDFLEDGILDVLLVNATSDGASYSMGAYKDSLEYDVMFMKVLVLTGVCYHDCPHSTIPYGTNQPGSAIRYTMTSPSGGTQKACISQMFQTSHFALQTPFSVFGLGRNWNFIDRLEIGISNPTSNTNNSSDLKENSSAKNVRSASFTQIIPNSQLVVIPYPIDRPSLWTTKIFITPSKALLLTAISLTATCLIVGIIVVVLHIRDKQEDKLERRQQAQRFHFDAM